MEYLYSKYIAVQMKQIALNKELKAQKCSVSDPGNVNC